MKHDSFTVDMEPISRITSKDITFTSEINRNLSRKVSQIVDEKKMNSSCLMNIDGDREVITSPKGSLSEGIIPEKLVKASQSANNHTNPHIYCKITIATEGITTTTTKLAVTPTKSSCSRKRLSRFNRSSVIKPRGILFIFATLSSLGTILLICLTLSTAKYNADVNY